ncbi:MAG: methylenetetrahydrofolate--tRNA-(uracil(54)-C(5))-methyltransferase (FADH(2)-oxidizing) TrmFO [Candidatus Hydrogenedentes bacterium CG1_02_42_14]|nr:MAG: methylenetetrahydrofolate--tRNA-(uracil(54)-C(5))-methyltransferase (FADH(2)-oxidizing) TrmFO [Candidatus Hydrogenedentes bacterium CG1_02_42_14]
MIREKAPTHVTIIGGGLAGSEAAWQIAQADIDVALYEMRPIKTTEAHRTDLLAELVCSNSFRASDSISAAGTLKDEMRELDSIVMRAADAAKIPSGKSLAVDRNLFSANVTDLLSSHPRIKIIRQEISEIPDGNVIIASGPLTSNKLVSAILQLTNSKALSFYDAIAPIIDSSTLTPGTYFEASRYSDEKDYLNVPLSEENYKKFVEELISAETFTHLDEDFFEGCLPIEEMARRGEETLRFGPMKPVGLIDPETERRPYAVIQLRRENMSGVLYNLVGFQTRLKIAEQDRIFRMIPAFANASFIRYGSAHRNTFIDSQNFLSADLSIKIEPRIKIAGQLSGVEGYIESAASGIVAGISTISKNFRPLPEETIIGGLIRYITAPSKLKFQPMKANWGVVSELNIKISKGEKKQLLAERSRESLKKWKREILEK